MTEGNGEVRELPKGWIEVALKDLFTPNRPKVSPQEYPDLPFIGMEHISPQTMKLLGTDVAKNMKSNAVYFQKGDVLYGRLRPYLNKVYKPDFEGLCSSEFIVFPENRWISLRYIQYLLNSAKFVSFSSHLNEGDRPRVDFNAIGNYRFYLPPLFEQNRIVEKIEELFSDIDQGVESLKMAQKQLKVYRQAVLKWAFEGKLTEVWRSQQPTLKTGEALLAQIKAERENRYQKRLAEWEEKVREWEAIGKAGKKPTKPQTPKEPSSLTKAELVELPKLPEGWCWAKVGLILLIPPSNGHSVKDRKGGFKVLRLTAIRNGLIDIRKSKEGDWDEEDAHPYIVQPGDFLLARGNGSINLVGAGGLVSEKSDVAYPDTMIKLIIDKSIFISKLFALLWNSAYFRKQIEKSVRTTAGIYKINQNHINNFLVPLTPINEQGQIAEEIESRLSICDQLEATIIENLQKAEALRQSILKQAFEGKLVPQDPNDEPAEKLLERIRAERQEKESQKTSKPLR